MSKRRAPLVLVLVVVVVLGIAVANVVVRSARAGQAVGSSRDDACRRSAEVVRDVEYDQIDGVDPRFLSLDLHLPATNDDCDLVPLIVGVHGGGWVVGDKRGYAGDKAVLPEKVATDSKAQLAGTGGGK